MSKELIPSNKISTQLLGFIRRMASASCQEPQIAAAIGLDYETFRKWKKRHPQVQRAIAKGKKDPVFQMEESLFQTGRGFVFPEEKTKEFFDAEGNFVGKQVMKTNRLYPPSVKAQQFYLINNSERYQASVKAQVSGSVSLKDFMDLGSKG